MSNETENPNTTPAPKTVVIPRERPDRTLPETGMPSIPGEGEDSPLTVGNGRAMWLLEARTEAVVDRINRYTTATFGEIKDAREVVDRMEVLLTPPEGMSDRLAATMAEMATAMATTLALVRQTHTRVGRIAARLDRIEERLPN